MKPSNEKILIVEDDLSLGFLLLELLEAEGYQAKVCPDGELGWEQFRKGRYDLCILDVTMPKMDGFTLAEKIKAENPDFPFLFLSARSLTEDKLRGYAIGAEDYLVKPFCEEELLCKIKVVLRRNQSSSVDTIPTNFKIGQFQFNYNRQELSFQQQTKRLTQKENEILRLLCLHQNRILKRDEAVEKIYGKRDYFLGRSFDVFISKLRKILKADPEIRIENVFKVGFILHVPEQLQEGGRE